MPDSPPDPRRPAPSALPARRPDGDKPRAFADQTAAPIDLPDAGEGSSPVPNGGAGSRAKASLPSERKKDRDLPSLTPAPYQAEPTSGTTPSVRAALPGPRHAHETSKFRPPPPHLRDAGASDELTEPPAAAPASTPAAPDPTARPAKHRLAANRKPEMTQQATIDHDPEMADSWGQAPQDAVSEHRKSRRLVLWAALIGAPLVGFALWQSLGRPGAVVPSPTAPVVTAESSTDAAGESRRAGEAVKRFLAAGTIDEAAALVRHPEVTKPRMEAWYSAANPLKPRSVLEFHDRSAEQTIDEVNFLMVSMDLDDHTSRSIAVEKQPDGSFLVDWESFVFWSDPRWPEFLSKEPVGSHDFRVTVQIDNYFNFGYADAKQWFCYKLEDPDRWATCWGYCSIDSEAGMQINRMIRRQLQQGQNQVKAILKLKFEPGGKGRNQVLIEDVAQDGWVKAGP